MRRRRRRRRRTHGTYNNSNNIIQSRVSIIRFEPRCFVPPPRAPRNSTGERGEKNKKLLKKILGELQ